MRPARPYCAWSDLTNEMTSASRIRAADTFGMDVTTASGSIGSLFWVAGRGATSVSVSEMRGTPLGASRPPA